MKWFFMLINLPYLRRRFAIPSLFMIFNTLYSLLNRTAAFS